MKSRGFTLIELMIVVAIVAFLAAVAVPKYFQYQTKARQVEVATMLASLHTAQLVYYAEHGSYTNVLWGKDGIGWKPEGYKGGGKKESFYYTYGFNFPGAQEGIHYFTGKLETAKDALGESGADKDTFLVKAAGDMGGKYKIDLWSVDEARNIVHVQDAFA